MSSASDLLHAAGLRRTPSRVRVLDAIEALARPLSHAELKELPNLAPLDEVTLYRTLTALVEGGLVHRVFGLDGTWRYCAQPRGRAGCPGNHPHFLCTACGSMTCLVTQPLPRVEVPEGASVEGRHFVVHGRCAGCVAQPSTAPQHGESA